MYLKKEIFKQRYQRLEILGEGSYGKVYKALDIGTQQFVALKKMKQDDIEDSLPSTTLREIAILKRLKHPNVVQLLDYYIFVDKTYLVFEFVDYDLRKFIDSNENSFQMIEIQSIIKQICQGLDFCHSQGILHRDLKPQNILVSKNGTIKIADFGLARQYHFSINKIELSQNVATLWYRSPEILLGEQNYSFTLDIWSVGCILMELLQKKPLFMGDSQIDQIFKIFQFHGTPEIGKLTEYSLFKQQFPKFEPQKQDFYKRFNIINEQFIDLAEKLLDLNSDQRITAKEILQHSFLNN